jgi:hypothetical protein
VSLPPELDGAVIPGGCDNCEAEQGLAEIRPGIWSIEIRHDDTCPTYQHILAQREVRP